MQRATRKSNSTILWRTLFLTSITPDYWWGIDPTCRAQWRSIHLQINPENVWSNLCLCYDNLSSGLYTVIKMIYLDVLHFLPLKPMDSLGNVVKIKWNYFSSLNHNFIVLCELLMPYQLFAQKCSNCPEITQISKCSGSSRTLCHW